MTTPEFHVCILSSSRQKGYGACIDTHWQMFSTSHFCVITYCTWAQTKSSFHSFARARSEQRGTSLSMASASLLPRTQHFKDTTVCFITSLWGQRKLPFNQVLKIFGSRLSSCWQYCGVIVHRMRFLATMLQPTWLLLGPLDKFWRSPAL